ncbi:hypothetical protein [Zunongwangia endophytica]|uniref:Molybdenum ABC transporter permease n=1 Tax=Zunongwangia endophytica TaxID=1808945 RepID=A0ABV8HAZ4_9FLAO|nr:hypothetical protein [Zunongwangia endophytica]MDN3593264.1 hypothetical protein [Zunongwangia endophytica]MDN3594235.1 hypothetical protein [Zunongwangia endophytica]
MENVLTFILGALLIALGIIWYDYERKKFVAQRKNEDYMRMSFTIEFILGAFILFAIGIRLIYDSF